MIAARIAESVCTAAHVQLACRHHDLYELTRRHVAMLPMFGASKDSPYLKWKFTSSVIVSLSTHVPLVFAKHELDAYSFFDDSCVFLRVRTWPMHAWGTGVRPPVCLHAWTACAVAVWGHECKHVPTVYALGPCLHAILEALIYCIA